HRSALWNPSSALDRFTTSHWPVNPRRSRLVFGTLYGILPFFLGWAVGSGIPWLEGLAPVRLSIRLMTSLPMDRPVRVLMLYCTALPWFADACWPGPACSTMVTP